MRRDQIGFLNRMIADYGDIVWIRVLGIKMALLNHPDYIEHVLVRNHPRRSVAPYLAGMRSWMRGNLEWSASTRRYRGSSRAGDPAEYLEAVLVDRGQT